MPDISNAAWTEVDGSNTTAPPAGWPEGMAANAVNDTARMMMGAIKRFYDHANASVTSGGAANVQTLTYTVAPAALVRGDAYSFIVGFTNTGATTLNINGLGATAIKVGTSALLGGELRASTVATVMYDGTAFQLLHAFSAVSRTENSYTANATLSTLQANQLVALGGNSFFTLTIGDPTTYQAGTTVQIVNTDAWGVSTPRAKKLSFTTQSGLNVLLWPTQTCWLTLDDNAAAWRLSIAPRVRLPSGTVTFNFDPVDGSDTALAVDGLGTTTGAFKTPGWAIEVVSDAFDWQAAAQTNLVLLNKAGATVSSGFMHWAPHGTVGAHGGDAIHLDLNGGTFNANTSQPCALVYFGGMLSVRNGTFASPAGGAGCLVATQGGQITVLDLVTFGTLVSGTAHMAASHGGRILIANDYSISGSNAGAYHWQAIEDGEISTNGTIVATLTAGLQFSQLALAGQKSLIDISTLSFNMNGHVFTSTPAYLVNTDATFYQNAGTPLNGSYTGITAGSWDPYVAFTPNVTISGGGSVTVSTFSGQYFQRGNQVKVSYDLLFTTTSGSATAVAVDLPVSGGAQGAFSASGKEIAVNNKGLSIAVPSSGGAFEINYADGTVPFANGLHLIISGEFQAVAP
jgi:hypothetical protein